MRQALTKSMSNIGKGVQLGVVKILDHPLWISSLSVLLLFLVFNPGYMTNDSLSHYSLAGRLDQLSLYHPPAMPYFFSIGRLFSDDQTSILLIQIIIFISGVYFLASSLFGRKAYVSLTIAVISIYPALFPIIGTLWKSVWMTAFLLWAGGFVLHHAQRPRWWTLTGAVLFLFAALFSRFDAIAPVGVMLFMLAVTSMGPALWRRGIVRPRATLIASFIIALGAVLVVGAIVRAGNEAMTVRNLHPSHVFLYQDLMSVSIQVGEVRVPRYIADENPGLTVEQLQAAYAEHTCNAFLRIINNRSGDAPYRLRRPSNDAEAKQFAQAWRRAVLDHPMAYAQGRLGIVAPLLGLTDQPHFPYYVGVAENSLGLTIEQTPVQALAETYAHFWAYDVKVFHRPWLYIMVLLAVFAAGWRRTPQGTGVQPAFLLLPAAGISHILTIASITCASDFRFAFLLCTFSVIGVIAALVNRFAPHAFLDVDDSLVYLHLRPAKQPPASTFTGEGP